MKQAVGSRSAEGTPEPEDAPSQGCPHPGRPPKLGDRLHMPSARAVAAMLSGVSTPLVLGFALCQTWNILCVALPDPITYSAPFHDLRWVSLTTCAGLLLLSAIWSEQAQRLLQSGRALIALGTVASAGSFLGPASALQPAFAYPLIYIAAVAVGIGFALMPLAWYNLFCVRRDMMGLALSVAVTAVLTYGLANVLTTDLVSTWVSAVVGSALPLASMAILAHGAKRDRSFPADRESSGRSLTDLTGAGARATLQASGSQGAAERTGAYGRESSTLPDPSGPQPLPDGTANPAAQTPPVRNRAVLLRFCLCMLVVIAAIEAVRNLLLSGTALTFYAGAANLLGLGLKISSTAWLLYLFETYDSRGVSAVYRIAFLMMLGVVLCIPSLLAGNWLAHTLLDLGSYFFQMTMLMVAYQICIGFRLNPVLAFGLIRTVWALAALAGIGLGHAIASAETSLGLQALTVGIGLAVAFVFTFVFTDRDCIAVLARMPKRAAASPFRDKMRSVAARFGLSDRELEVMTLVAKGRSATRIAEDLTVAPATVNSHISHIYRKLDVHSRQELLDLVERE